MDILTFLNDSNWDAPFFKRLAHNDTGQAEGHQGGMVLPKELRRFLPDLDSVVVSGKSPTVDRRLSAELFSASVSLGFADLRYQFQTWRAGRRPESRITDGFRSIHKIAREGDLLLIQRRVHSIDTFRFVLLQQGTPAFAAIRRRIGNRRWGPVNPAMPPVSSSELAEAEHQMAVDLTGPFVLLQPVNRTPTTVMRQARSLAFRKLLGKAYRSTCAISGIGLLSPLARTEVECAHVVPLHEGGADDLRNGLVLTKTLHWAFDLGLVGVLPKKRIVYVVDSARKMAANTFLSQFHGQNIREAQAPKQRTHDDALDWHLNHRVSRWT